MGNKITLEELAPYLPYGLKCQFSTGTIFELGLFNNYRGQGIENRTIDQCLDMKPLVRPLSQLTQEIEHNGERFVPLLKIAEMICGHRLILEKYDSDGYTSYGWTDRGMEDCQGYEFTFSEKSMSFAVYYSEKCENESPLYLVGGYREIQKLLSWHFDIFNLIERGLALPVED